MAMWAKLRKRLPRPGTRSFPLRRLPIPEVFPVFPVFPVYTVYMPNHWIGPGVETGETVKTGETGKDWVDLRLGLCADAPHEPSGQAIDQARCHRVEDHRHPEDARENHEGPGAVRQRGNRLCDLRGGEAQPPRHQIPGIRPAVPPELRSLHGRRIDPADGNAWGFNSRPSRSGRPTQPNFLALSTDLVGT